MKLLYQGAALLIALTIVVIFSIFAVGAKRNEFYNIEISSKYTHEKNYFISKYDITPYSEEENGYLNSYASSSCTEFNNASTTDLRVETYIANEMEDSIFSNLYTQVAYVNLSIVLDSGETHKEESYALSAVEGSSCIITASGMNDFKTNDSIKYFWSEHMIFIDIPSPITDYPSGHPNNTVRIYHSRDYFLYQ